MLLHRLLLLRLLLSGIPALPLPAGTADEHAWLVASDEEYSTAKGHTK